MKKILFLFAMLFAFNVYAIEAIDKDAIKSVVSGHMDALNKGDFDTAWQGLAQDTKILESAGEFGKNVTREVPMFIRNNGLQYGEATVDKGKVMQPVAITDTYGVVWVALFFMVIEFDTWKIEGVTINQINWKGV